MAGALHPVERAAYKLLSEIGSGVSAVVYKASCLPLNSAVVAIKAIDLDRTRASLDDVRREAKAMSILSHPNILTAHCSFAVGRHLWVVMPFMAAGSLHSIISSSFPDGLSEPLIAIVLKDTLHALHYLHCQGQLHRDVKASNILVDSDGSVKLADFGVSASIFEPSSSSYYLSASTSLSALSFFNDLAGTPYWMAPEVIHSHVGYSFKADIWSFGITALELAHGRPPLSHLPPSKSLVMRITSRFHLDSDDFNDNTDTKAKKKFSKAFKDLVSSCLDQDPSKRPTAEKLLKHPFFKNCKSSDYLVRHLLHGLPVVEERFRQSLLRPPCRPFEDEDDDEDDDENNANLGITKIRRISGWNFNEEIFKLDPVFPCDDKQRQEDSNSHLSLSSSSCSSCSSLEESCREKDREEDEEEIKYEERDRKYEGENLVLNSTVTAAALVPELIALLNSLSIEREMVMNVLEICRGGEKSREEEREQRLVDMVGRLQRTVDALNLQLNIERAKNSALEKELEQFKLRFHSSSSTP